MSAGRPPRARHVEEVTQRCDATIERVPALEVGIGGFDGEPALSGEQPSPLDVTILCDSRPVGEERAHLECNLGIGPGEVHLDRSAATDRHREVAVPVPDPRVVQPTCYSLLEAAAVPDARGALIEEFEQQPVADNSARWELIDQLPNLRNRGEAMRQAVVEAALDGAVVDESRQEQHCRFRRGDPR